MAEPWYEVQSHIMPYQIAVKTLSVNIKYATLIHCNNFNAGTQRIIRTTEPLTF